VKILIVARGFPTARYPQHGVFEFDQARALARLGHEVSYIAVDLRSVRRKRPWGRQSLERDGVQIESMALPIGRLPQPLRSPVYDPFVKSLYHAVEERLGRPDIVHAHFPDVQESAVRCLARRGLPVVVTEHSAVVHTRTESPSKRRATTRCYRQASAVIAVSRSLAEVLRQEYGVQARVVHNMVDTTLFEFRGTPGAPEDEFRYCSTASLYPGKRLDVLIRGFAALHAVNPKCRLDIFGEGPERARLQSLIDSQGLQGVARLNGMHTRAEIAEAYARSHAFALVSGSETFGVAYVEALAAGLPVVGSRCGGPEDFVGPGDGILVAADANESEVAAALGQLVDGYSRYDRAAISGRVREEFSEASVAAQLSAVYHDVMVGA